MLACREKEEDEERKKHTEEEEENKYDMAFLLAESKKLRTKPYKFGQYRRPVGTTIKGSSGAIISSIKKSNTNSY